MAQFHYRASDDSGREFEGDLECETLADAITELESNGWVIAALEVVTALNPDSTLASPDSPTPPFDADPSTSAYRLESYFDSVIERRDQLLPVLAALTDAIPRGTARQEIQQLTKVLKKARSGSELSSSPHAIRWLPLLLTGLTQETATQRLGDLLAMAARESRNRSDRRRMLAYPGIVLLITCGIFALLCTFIVPSFSAMFKDFGLVLPASTRLVVEISSLFTDQLASTMAMLGIAAVVFFIAARLWTRFALTTPVFGRLVAGNASNVSAMASLISQLADLLSIGISLPDALRLAGKGCDHHFFQRATEGLAQYAHDPSQPLQSCRAANVLPGNLIHALTAGPDGTPHLALLHELGTMYSDHATHRTSWMTGAVAQFSIVLTGLAVGFVVIALFAPLVTLIQGLS